MSSNITAFDLAVKTWGETVPPEQVQKLHRAVQLEALKGVVLTTPVDTGQARGGWDLTIGEPAAAAPGTLDKSGGVTIARGSAAVARIQAYSVSWLANLLPYIVELEGGSSKQAPRGIVAVTVARIRAMFE